MPIQDIVNVSITRETTAVSQAGFGTPCIVGESDNLPKLDIITITIDAQLIASNVITVYVNGVKITDTTYAASSAATMGVIAGKIQALAAVATAVVSGASDEIITVTSVAGSVVIINSFVVTLGASQAVATIVRIAATRIRSYSTMTEVAVDYATTDLEYLAANAILTQSPKVPTLKIAAYRSGDASWTAALNAIILEDNDWYGLIITSRTQADIEAVALWCETQVKIFIAASNQAAILTAVTTDIAGVMNAAAYDRSTCFYHPDADASTNDPYPDAAWMGKMLPTNPGSATWMFKTLAGIAVTTLTTTEANFALGKKCNTYQLFGGVNITREGTMASGEYIDVIRGLDWLNSRMTERIFGVLVNSDKVPYTDPGIATIEAEVRAQLNQGISRGLLTNNPEYTVSVPEVADVSSADKIARELDDVTFLAYLAGAIHYVAVAGVVTV